MTEITIEQVTSGTIEGSGAFDEIMKASQVRLHHEYEKDRIKGTEYSKVYLGAMEAAMQQSIAYVLGRQQASAQADLTLKQGELVAIELINAIKQGELIDQQVLKMQSEILIDEQQIKLLTQQVINLQAELPKIIAETSLLVKQEALITQQIINAEKQNEKLDKDIELTTWQVFTEAAKVTDTFPGADGVAYPVGGVIKRQNDKVEKEIEILEKQKSKTDEEVKLLEAKKFTEQAQIQDTVNGASVTGTVGKQKEVYTAQENGFRRKAEIDLAKIMSDNYSVRRSTDESEPVPGGLKDANITSVIQKAGDGIGVSIDTA